MQDYYFIHLNTDDTGSRTDFSKRFARAITAGRLKIFYGEGKSLIKVECLEPPVIGEANSVYQTTAEDILANTDPLFDGCDKERFVYDDRTGW